MWRSLLSTQVAPGNAPRTCAPRPPRAAEGCRGLVQLRPHHVQEVAFLSPRNPCSSPDRVAPRHWISPGSSMAKMSCTCCSSDITRSVTVTSSSWTPCQHGQHGVAASRLWTASSELCLARLLHLLRQIDELGRGSDLTHVTASRYVTA